MNRTETTALLKRLHVIWALGRPADTDTIDEWASTLAGHSFRDGNDALDRIMAEGEAAPKLPRVLVELRAISRARHPISHVVQLDDGETLLTDAEYAAIGQRAIKRIRAEAAERARARAHLLAGRRVDAADLGLHLVSGSTALDALDPDVEPF